LIVSYLENQTLASAQALFVICRYLAEHRSSGTVERLQKALAPTAVTVEAGRAGRTADVPPVLRDSLAVGVDLGILEVEGSREQRVWTLRDDYTKLVKEMPTTDSRRFRSLLLRRFGVRALASVEEGERPPDVPFALVWLLTRDPMSSLPHAWDQELQDTFEQAGMRSAVYNQEQWRPFRRWARALGLIAFTAVGSKSRVLIDPTRAVEGVLDELPQRASAIEWLARLHTSLPLLGDPRLLNVLPSGRPPEGGPSAAIALAMLRLEHAGRLRLVPADDAADAVVLRLGNQVRRVAHIQAVEDVA
jgi:hypothetical protein